MADTPCSPYSIPVSSRLPVRPQGPASKPRTQTYPTYSAQEFSVRRSPTHQWIPGVTTPHMTPQRVVPVRPAISSTLTAGAHRRAMAGSPGYVVAARVIITGLFASALITIPTACYAVATHLPSTGR